MAYKPDFGPIINARKDRNYKNKNDDNKENDNGQFIIE